MHHMGNLAQMSIWRQALVLTSCLNLKYSILRMCYCSFLGNLFYRSDQKPDILEAVRHGNLGK